MAAKHKRRTFKRRQTEKEIIQELIERSNGTLEFVEAEQRVPLQTVRRTHLQRGRTKTYPDCSTAMSSGSGGDVLLRDDDSVRPPPSGEQLVPHMEGGLDISREIANAVSPSKNSYLAALHVNTSCRHVWKAEKVIDLKSEDWEQTTENEEEYTTVEQIEMADAPANHIHFFVGTWNGKHFEKYSLAATESFDTVLEDYSKRDPARALERTLSFTLNNKPVGGDDTPAGLQLPMGSMIYATPNKIKIVLRWGKKSTIYGVELCSPLTEVLGDFWEAIPPDAGSNVTFVYNKNEILHTDTPYSLGMDTNDTITVFPEVVMGFYWKDPFEDWQEQHYPFSLGVEDPMSVAFDAFEMDNVKANGRVCFRWGGKNLTGSETIASLGMCRKRGAKIKVYCLPLPPNFQDSMDEVYMNSEDEDSINEDAFVEEDQEVTLHGEQWSDDNVAFDRGGSNEESHILSSSASQSVLGHISNEDSYSTNANNEAKTEPEDKEEQVKGTSRTPNTAKKETQGISKSRTAQKEEMKSGSRDVFDFCPSDNEDKTRKGTEGATLSGKPRKGIEAKAVQVTVSFIRPGQKDHKQRQNQVVTKHRFTIKPHHLFTHIFKEFQKKERSSKSEFVFLHEGRKVDPLDTLKKLGLANCHEVELDAKPQTGFVKRRANCPPATCRQQLDAPARDKLKGIQNPIETFMKMTTPYTRSDLYHRDPGAPPTEREKDEASWPHNVHGMLSILEMAPNKDGQNPSSNVLHRLQKPQVHIFVGSAPNSQKAKEYLKEGQFDLIAHSTWDTYMSALTDKNAQGEAMKEVGRERSGPTVAQDRAKPSGTARTSHSMTESNDDGDDDLFLTSLGRKKRKRRKEPNKSSKYKSPHRY